jgi:8-oxo-dGTP pyrophosphatase MutT (NUDIX family)
MAEITPIPAATVTLVRDAGNGIEILMMQRNLNSGFVPGAHVFPGGALDASDSTPEMRALCRGISDEQASRTLGIDEGGLAYWTAAIRESFEEAGMLIAYDAAERVIPLDNAEVAERFHKHRHGLNRGTRSLLEILRGEGLVLAADQLVYFSHWTTPASAPRRYDTRFFAAAAPAAQEPLHDDKETIAHTWVRPSDALDRYKQGNFKMRFPTVRTLEEFAAYDTADSLLRAMRAKRNIPHILPRITERGARLVPGEPGYGEVAAHDAQIPWKT